MVIGRTSFWALSALVASGLFGCGGKGDEAPPTSTVPLHPVLGCEAIDPTPCDVRQVECEQKLLDLAACMRGSEPGALPPVTHMTVPEFTAEMQTEADAATPEPETPHIEATLVLLGLAEPGSLDESANLMRSATNVLAFYRDDSDDIVIIDRDDADPVESNSTLLHEFVHALQDRESDLTAYEKAHFDGPLDSFLATDAIVEGEARFHEYVFDLSLLGYDPRAVDLTLFFERIVGQDEPLFVDEPSAMIMAPYVFPYDWGARYVHLAWTGHQSILDLLASPPETTHAIMNSVDRLTDDTFTPSDATAPSPPDAWVAVTTDNLGAFGTFLLLQKLGGTNAARELGLAWRGDSAFIYAGSEASGDPTATAFAWSCDFDDAAHAGSAAQLIQGGLPGVEVRTSGTRVTLAAADDGSDVGWAFATTAP